MNRYPFGTKAGLRAGTLNALFLNIMRREVYTWSDQDLPDMGGPALQDTLALRTYLRLTHGKTVVEAAAFVVGVENNLEITPKQLNEAIDAASALFNNGKQQFAGTSFENGKLITAVRYSGQLENVPAIDFAIIGDGEDATKLLMLTIEGAKVYDLTTKKWTSIMIDGLAPTDLDQVRGITRFVAVHGQNTVYTTMFSLKNGEMIAVELRRNQRGNLELVALPGRISFKDMAEVVGPIAGNIEQVGGFDKSGGVVRIDRLTFAKRLESAGASARTIAAYAQTGGCAAT